MRVLLVHSGHAFSTADTYSGMLWGLRHCGAEVVEYRWDRTLATINILVSAAVAQGAIPAAKHEDMMKFGALLASADALTVAVEKEVEAVLVINGILFPAQRAAILKHIGLPVACYGTEAPYLIDRELHQAQGYSHWFTQERNAVPTFAKHLPTTYLPMAYNPDVHHPAPSDRAADVVFVGGGYPERKATLGAEWPGIDRRLIGTLWHLDAIAPESDLSQGNVSNEAEAVPWYRGAAVNLNLHRLMTEPGRPPLKPGTAYSLGPRPYEVAACGGFLLSDDERPELREVFGESAATFKAWDATDCERQARYWLAHPDARERRAAEQYAAVQPHHWGARARTVLETITP